MGSWTVGNFCKNCHKEIKYNYSRGVCPYCINISADAMVDTYIRLYKDIRTSPWWKFWKVDTHRIYAKDKEK